MCDNDIGFVKKMHVAFVEQNKDVVQNLLIFVTDHNYTAIKQRVHALKSSFNVLGVTACAQEIASTESDEFDTYTNQQISDVVEKIIAVYIQAAKEYSIFIQNLPKTQ